MAIRRDYPKRFIVGHARRNSFERSALINRSGKVRRKKGKKRKKKNQKENENEKEGSGREKVNVRKEFENYRKRKLAK